MKPDTRTAILDAAEELIRIRGSNGISYQSISDVVRIRKASIHYHFPTKEKLIEEVIHRYSTRFLGLVDAIIASADPAPVKLRRYFDLFERALRDGSGQKVCLCGMLGAELASLGGPAMARLRGFYRENAERLARILEQGRKAGTIHFNGDGKTLGMLLFSSLEGAMLIARADEGVRQFRSLKGQLFKLLCA